MNMKLNLINHNIKNLTMTSGYIIKYRGDVALSKLLCIVDQCLSDCLISSQDHDFVGSKVKSKYRAIFL